MPLGVKVPLETADRGENGFEDPVQLRAWPLRGYSARGAAGGVAKVQRGGGIKVFDEQNGCFDKEMEE